MGRPWIPPSPDPPDPDPDPFQMDTNSDLNRTENPNQDPSSSNNPNPNRNNPHSDQNDPAPIDARPIMANRRALGARYDPNENMSQVYYLDQIRTYRRHLDRVGLPFFITKFRVEEIVNFALESYEAEELLRSRDPERFADIIYDYRTTLIQEYHARMDFDTDDVDFIMTLYEFDKDEEYKEIVESLFTLYSTYIESYGEDIEQTKIELINQELQNRNPNTGNHD